MASNYRVEHINFYVTDFNTAYHAILGRPALAKFMAIPHYACLSITYAYEIESFITPGRPIKGPSRCASINR